MEQHFRDLFNIVAANPCKEDLFRYEPFQTCMRGILGFCPEDQWQSLTLARSEELSAKRSASRFTQGFEDLLRLPEVDVSVELWDPKALEHSQQTSPVLSLFAALDRCRGTSHKDVLQSRILMVLLAHQLQFSYKTPADIDHHIAVAVFGKENSTRAKALAKLRRKASTLLALAECGSLGALGLPSSRSLWEGTLTAAEISQLWQHCARRHPIVVVRARSLHEYVVQSLTAVEQIYNVSTLRSGGTRLSRCITQPWSVPSGESLLAGVQAQSSIIESDPHSVHPSDSNSPKSLQLINKLSQPHHGMLTFQLSSAPTMMQHCEQLLQRTTIYFECICSALKLDHNGALVETEQWKSRKADCEALDSYCFTATKLFAQNYPKEAAFSLNKAFELIAGVVEDPHPRTLACFLEILVHLTQESHPLVATMFRKHVAAISKIKLPETSHWRQVCELLRCLDEDTLETALIRVWECALSTFERVLGKAGRLVISCRLDLIKRRYSKTHYEQEENDIHDMLSYGNNNSSLSRIYLTLARNSNKQGHHKAAEERARTILHHFADDENFAGNHVGPIECSKIIAESYYKTGRIDDACAELQNAISMVKCHLGPEHAWVMEFETVLRNDWGSIIPT